MRSASERMRQTSTKEYARSLSMRPDIRGRGCRYHRLRTEMRLWFRWAAPAMGVLPLGAYFSEAMIHAASDVGVLACVLKRDTELLIVLALQRLLQNEPILCRSCRPKASPGSLLDRCSIQDGEQYGNAHRGVPCMTRQPSLRPSRLLLQLQRQLPWVRSADILMGCANVCFWVCGPCGSGLGECFSRS
jgi:hypothetical protein